MKVMTIGPARVGKTWLRNLLLGQAPPEHSPSTPVLGTAQTISMFKNKRIASDTVSASNAGWSVIDTPSHIRAYLHLLQEGEYIRGDHYKTERSNPPSLEPLSVKVSMAQSFTSGGESQDKPPTKQQPVATEQQSCEEPIARCLYNAIRTIDFKQEHINLCNTRILQFLDSGGQLAYHDILPVFITSPAVYLHVFNLSQPLDDRPRDTIELENGKCLESGPSPLSTLEMISRSMLTVHSFANKKMKLPCLADKQNYPRSRMMLVGTHLDRLEEEQESEEGNMEKTLKAIEKKSEEISKVIRRRLQFVECKMSEAYNCMFFPVNNLLYQAGSTSSSNTSSRSAVLNQAEVQRDSRRREVPNTRRHSSVSVSPSKVTGVDRLQVVASQSELWVQQLQDEIENVAKKVELDIPVKWYLHQLAISSQNEGKPIRVYGKLLHFCLENKVVDSASEFHDMVTLFHTLGLLVHHDIGDEPHEAEKHGEDSKCLIFTNPSFLYQKISKMYLVQFLQVTDPELQDLKEFGIFTKGAFRLLELHKDLRCDWFMDMLQCLYIGAAVQHNNENVIFVPSVLTAKEQNFWDDKEALHTFVITFHMHGAAEMKTLNYIPSGVFTSAVAHLQRSEHNWNVDFERISRIAMTFTVNGTDYVQLCDCTTNIKVGMYSDHSSINDETCQSYRDAVLTAVSNAYKHLFHDIAELILGLPCPGAATHIRKLYVPLKFNRGGELQVKCEQCRPAKPKSKESDGVKNFLDRQVRPTPA